MVRGAFEYQGQKCSAMSRAYIPSTIWPDIESNLLHDIETLTMGDPRDYTKNVNAVIDKKAFDSIKDIIEDPSKSYDPQLI